MASKSFEDLCAAGLYTETPLHCGAESGTGYVDLPIQRERHTQYPVIPGSTIKGVLKDELDLTGEARAAIFGAYDSEAKSTSPGSVSFGDGVLVAFPVRSSTAPFHWVTCPFALERAFRALGKEIDVKQPEPREAFAAGAGEVLLEEISLKKHSWPEFFSGEAKSGLAVLLTLLPTRGFGYTRSIFGQRLLVLSDEDFRLLVETGTEIVTRIKLTALGTTTSLKKGERTDITGQDREGNLFVEELVPPETLFLSSMRGDGRNNDLVSALGKRSLIRIGGDETIGRGVTHMTVIAASKGN